jgi:NDP-sugar pyrophosphorylase family protein
MELKLDYYFSNYEGNEVFKKLIEGIENVTDIHESGRKFLEENVIGKDLKENHGELVNDNVTFIGNYYIGEGTKIYPGVVIEGPVYIGKGVKIMPGAYVRPGTITGDKCVIGFNSEIKNSIIQNGAKIASLAFVGDSILGKSARIGSGVITANRRFDQQNIKFKKPDGTQIDSNTDFFGCVLGDYVRIGANSVTSPGTLVGPYSWIFPATSIYGFIPKEKRVYNKPNWVVEENGKTELK